MRRSNTMDALDSADLTSYKQRIAYHEAGHATAIHFFNNQKKLPPVFFEIVLHKDQVTNQITNQIGNEDCIAGILGGRLIQLFPPAFDDLDQVFGVSDAHRLAFEMDIVNLLIGPLAEAKYTAQIDNETFTQQLFTIGSLKNYGGDADLAVVDDYLNSYSVDKWEYHERLNRLFIQAFNFVNDYANWVAITRLANYISASKKNKISYDEVAISLFYLTPSAT